MLESILLNHIRYDILTRDNNEDKDISRKERLEIAKKKDADFLFAIHYNMSEYHTLYGSEVWIPASGPLYKKGYQFADIELNALSNLGLYNRGIKVKTESDGSEYYGILKYAKEYNVPAVIIEHCHLDEERDSAFWNEEGYKQFGIIDADSVAKYFGLSSVALGIDNSSYELVDVLDADKPHSQDTTSPDICEISLLDTDIENGIAKISLIASDNDSNINYYSYSLDNGISFSRNETFINNEENIIEIPLSEETESNLIIRVFNKYDYCTDSNVLSLPIIPKKEQLNEAEDIKYTDNDIVIIKKQNDDDTILNEDVFLIAFGCMFLFLVFISIYVVIRINKLKRKRKRK